MNKILLTIMVSISFLGCTDSREAKHKYKEENKSPAITYELILINGKNDTLIEDTVSAYDWSMGSEYFWYRDARTNKLHKFKTNKHHTWFTREL